MLSLIFIVICAAISPGLLNRTRSILSGRKGPKLLQAIYNLALLSRKGAVYSSASGFVFRAAPTVSLAAIIVAMLMVPFGKFNSLISFPCDFVLFAYLFAVSRFAMILGALDTASSFEGMGASREALYGMLVEPAFFILAGTFAMISGYNSFEQIFGFFDPQNLASMIPGTLAAFTFFCMMLVETSRLPVDDPRTHLELTMIHEVMILDYCGFDLAAIQTANYLKAAIYAVLASLCLLPYSMNFAFYSPLFIFVVLLSPVITGIFESFRARNRLQRNPSYILTITAMAFVAFLTAAIQNMEH
ncbi:MAG: NADH-quinone oxidoreductase subunit H [Prevotellaceae bacterium]|nr:NADH-quinone oxidoreductase subunit H [Prevotellaceae bacterium]